MEYIKQDKQTVTIVERSVLTPSDREFRYSQREWASAVVLAFGRYQPEEFGIRNAAAELHAIGFRTYKSSRLKSIVYMQGMGVEERRLQTSEI